MKSAIKKISHNNRDIKLINFILGVFIVAFIYNAIFVKASIIVGGVSGLAIIVKEVFKVDTTLFIDICNILLILASFIMLGKKETFKQLMGCIMFPAMVTFTAPLSKMLMGNIEIDLIVLLISTLIYGFASGMIYRAGYSTGGSDIIVQILSVKKKKPITHFSPILHFLIIGCGGIVFKPVQILYSVGVIYLSNSITNRILFGISTQKMVYIVSKKDKEIENYIMNDIHTGATEIKVKGGIFEEKKQMLFCVVHNAQYKQFKSKILRIDNQAFIVANNCYEVRGGSMYRILPY